MNANEKGGRRGLGNRLSCVTCMQSVSTGQVLLQTSHTLLTITACVFHVTDQSVSFHTCVVFSQKEARVAQLGTGQTRIVSYFEVFLVACSYPWLILIVPFSSSSFLN